MTNGKGSQDRKDDFHIIVTGRTMSGKSSVLNVLLDDAVLPTRVLPCTAVTTIIRYGDEKKVLIHPKKGKYKGGDIPFEIPPEKLKEYQCINRSEEGMYYSAFEKIDVYWPAQCLKSGLVLIDTPGYNDWERPIIFSYSSDLILYCMSATQTFSNKDVEIIKELKEFSGSSLACIITMMDYLDDIDLDEDELQDFYRCCEIQYERLGFDYPPFYISSRLAMEALRENSDVKFAKSGFGQLVDVIDACICAKQNRIK